jgi:hypothetical protein
VLIVGLGLSIGGLILIRIALRQGRQDALFSSIFWATFPQFARYRIRRLWPAALGAVGVILLICGLVLLFQWVLAYYAARMGHPLPGALELIR